MKRSLFFAIAALAITPSCQKESVDSYIPEGAETIQATILNSSNSTKTTYDFDNVDPSQATNATFYWNGTESFARVLRYTGSNNYDKDLFVSSTGGKATSRAFTCATPQMNGSTYEDTKVAFYPYNDPDPNGANLCFEIGNGNTNLKYKLNEELVYDASAPLDGIVPMVGLLNGTGTAYDFKPLTGVLAVRVTGIPSTAKKLRISSETAKLSGTTIIITSKTDLSIIRDCIKSYAYDSGLYQGLLDSYANKTKTYSFTSLDPSKEYVFYFPLPTGAIPDLTVTLYKNGVEDKDILYTTTAKQSISIERSKITFTPLITCAPKAGITGPEVNPVFDIIHCGVKVRACLSKNSTQPGLSDYPSSFQFTDPHVMYNLTKWTGDGAFSGSGTYYLHYLVLNADVAASTLTDYNDTKIIKYGYLTFTYHKALGSELAGTYYINSETDNKYEVTIAATEGEDTEKGDIKITHFKGSTSYDVDMCVFGRIGNDNSITFDAPSSSPAGFEYSLGGTTTATGQMQAKISSSTQLKFSTDLRLYQKVGDTWTDQTYSFTSPSLYKQ